MLQTIMRYIILLLFTVKSNVIRYFCMTSNSTQIRFPSNVVRYFEKRVFIKILPLLSNKETI